MVCVIFFHHRRTQPAVCPLPSLLSVPYRDGNVAEHFPIQANNDVSELCCSDVWHVGHRQKESAHLLGVSSKTPFLLAEMEHSSAPSLAMKVCWGGWNPQVEMACVPPASGGRPPHSMWTVTGDRNSPGPCWSQCWFWAPLHQLSFILTNSELDTWEQAGATTELIHVELA